ncbi:class I SAM-dependent methyltransferase [Uliginosibacterium sp. sgz301328]|uniref:class I SAM-dependent methyltransferase n=1 Tax=Uliginosibacterium sp. sgz301328 TaxID=3243764 RepID=UPI00359EF82D
MHEREQHNSFEIPRTPKTCDCKICRAESRIVGLFDASFSGTDFRAGRKVGEYSGRPVYFYQCSECGFTFTRYFDAWDEADFAEHIYNDEYLVHDPDYSGKRASEFARTLTFHFQKWSRDLAILDYGSGSGILEYRLREAGFADVASFDPFTADSTPPSRKFNMVTCFEVFEHVTNPLLLMSNLAGLLEEGGGILLTTELCRPEIVSAGLDKWWYCVPRNGHISFQTERSMKLLGQSVGLQYHHFGESWWHAFFPPGPKPFWLDELIPA